MVKGIILLLSFCGICMIPAWASPSRSFGEDVLYRDSLRSHILATGFAQINCFLSYPIGESEIEPVFGNNAGELSALRRFLRFALEDTLVCVQRVAITGYCSVDGAGEVNDKLSLRRTLRVQHYLDAVYNLSRKYTVEVGSMGADWQGFRRIIDSSSYPWREEALRVIDSAQSPDIKKLWLANLGGGDAHKRMYEEIHPLLRRVEILVTYDRQRMKARALNAGLPALSSCITGIPELKESSSLSVCSDSLPFHLKGGRKGIRIREKQVLLLDKGPCNPLFSVKTNLLFDLALIPNIEVEIPLGRRWSLGAEVLFPWWLSDDNRYCMEVLSGGLEARLWLGDRQRHKPLTGHFAGFYLNGGEYDLQWDTKGYRGKYFASAGLTYGYSLPLSRRLNIEFSLGVGVLYTDYRQYEAIEDYQILLWQKDGKYTWIGPTKAKVSLVWLLGNRKGGRR